MLTAVQGLVQRSLFNSRVDTVEKALGNILDKINEVRHSALSQASSIFSSQQLELLNNMTLLSENLKILYEKEMEKTVDKANQAVQERLSQIDTMIQRIIGGITSPEVQDFAHQLKAVVVPFMGEKPFVTRVFPSVVSSDQPCVTISCQGHFPSAGSLSPTLRVGDETFFPINNIGSLDFSVPLKVLFEKSLMGKYEVVIPYVKSGWMIDSHLQQTYRSYIALLPQIPGKITLQYTEAKAVVKEEQISRQSTQNSKKHKHGGEDQSIVNRLHSLAAPSGWTIVPQTARIEIFSNEGKGNSWRQGCDGPATVSFYVSTHKGRHSRHSGRLSFELSATVSKIEHVFTKIEETINLNWGDSYAIDPSQMKYWKVIFEGHDGVREEYMGNGEGKFISIRSTDGRPVIRMRSPFELAASHLRSKL